MDYKHRARPPRAFGRGVAVSDIERLPWGAFVHFSDPDGNAWAIQDMTELRQG